METKDYLDLEAVMILIILTLFWGFNHPAIKISNQGVSPILTLFYQSVVIAIITYFVWFKLIHRHSVSRLSAFTFLAPILGVFFGVLILHDELTGSLMIGLPLVSAGILLVNWRKRTVLLT